MRGFQYLIAALLFVSCASTVTYQADYPMSSDLFRSRDGVLAGNIPEGWFSSTDDTLAGAYTVWLVRNDLAASLTFRELHLDRLSIERVKKEGLALLAVISGEAGQASGKEGKGAAAQDFKLGGRNFCAYETRDAGLGRRVVVFQAGMRFYECEVRALKGSWSGPETEHLFRLQQSVLARLVY